MEKDNKSSVRLNLGTILFLIFLTLKLAGLGVVATWSWWWVCSPLWISLAITLFIIGVASVILMLRDVFNLFK
jgi:fatty acid desaturase